MISFKEIESSYSLGNNLFQYTFTRSLAKKLKVKFYFPDWKGDKFLDLKDNGERVNSQTKLTRNYIEPNNDFSVKKDLFKIKDNTSIFGYFQSEDFFDKKNVRNWFKFDLPKFKKVEEKYKDIDFSKSVGMHLRFSDTKYFPAYYVPDKKYYSEALSKIGKKDYVLVFSDEIPLAKKYLKKIDSKIIYVEGNGPEEDLYLMTKCKDFICSASTLCWWGAWLNKNKDKKIICPKEGALRPTYSGFKRNYYFPKDWVKIKALRKGLLDHYLFKKIKIWVIYLPEKMQRFMKILLGKENVPVWDRYLKKF